VVDEVTRRTSDILGFHGLSTCRQVPRLPGRHRPYLALLILSRVQFAGCPDPPSAHRTCVDSGLLQSLIRSTLNGNTMDANWLRIRNYLVKKNENIPMLTINWWFVVKTCTPAIHFLYLNRKITEFNNILFYKLYSSGQASCISEPKLVKHFLKMWIKLYILRIVVHVMLFCRVHPRCVGGCLARNRRERGSQFSVGYSLGANKPNFIKRWIVLHCQWPCDCQCKLDTFIAFRPADIKRPYHVNTWYINSCFCERHGRWNGLFANRHFDITFHLPDRIDGIAAWKWIKIVQSAYVGPHATTILITGRLTTSPGTTYATALAN